MSTVPPDGTWDVVVIGSGIAGSILAAILARQGLSVLVLEAGKHPRFAIGESLIIEASEVFRALAATFDVPELGWFGSENQLHLIGSRHGVKRHFSFLHHRPGQNAVDASDVLQMVIPGQPYGHELHLYRADSDKALARLAVSLGATLVERCAVSEVITDSGGAEVHTDTGARHRARYVVDAGGQRSVLARQHGLRHENLRTHSRAVFTHADGVPSYHAVGPSRRALGVPYSVHEGTLHHVFDGGWVWVIPFDNHASSTNPLCSIGLVLDPRRHPAGRDPEEELGALLVRFPSIAAQLGSARPVRPWVSTERINYGSHAVVGERWALLGHAAGFVDPLFSKGLYIALSAVQTLAQLLIDAKRSGDWSTGHFAPLERRTRANLASADTVVADAFASFADPRLWRQYAMIWLIGAYLEGLRLSMARVEASRAPEGFAARYQALTADLVLTGGGWAPFRQLEADATDILAAVDSGDEASVVRADQALRQLLLAPTWIPPYMKQMVHGKNHLPRNKLRPGLLRPDVGLFGTPDFRRHFFGELGLSDLARFAAGEKLRHSAHLQRLAWLVGRVEALP